jgi:hypothetical protein
MIENIGAVRLGFLVQEVFPPDDPGSIPLLQLVSASNDALFMQRLIVQRQAWVSEPGEFDRIVVQGEIGYLFRMLCGHLYEAGRILQRWLEEGGGEAEMALLEHGGAEDGRAAQASLLSIYGDRSASGFFEAVLGVVRQASGAHYDERAFARAMEDGPRHGQVVLSRYAGLNRFTVADLIVDQVSLKVAGGDPEVLERQCREAMALARSLGAVVTRLILKRLERCETTSRTEHGQLRVPVALLRAHREGDAMRGVPVEARPGV